MTFSWTDSTPKTLVAEGTMAPDLPITANLEQNATMLRTYLGHGETYVIWSKWSFNFNWTNVPEALIGSLVSMLNSGATIGFTDTYIGNYSFRLTSDNISYTKTLYGLCNASAKFRQA